MSGTASGPAGTSPTCRRCRPRRWSGAPRWPAAGPPARSVAPLRPRCSPPPSARRCCRCRPPRSSWPPGRPPRSARTASSRSGRRCTRRRAAGPHPPAAGHRPGDRLGRLPAGEDRLPDADPGLVPDPGPGGGPGLHGARRRAARRERAVPAPRRPGRLGLAERHPVGRLEAACRRALEVGDPSYRTVKGILIARTETTETGTGDAGAAAHLHGPHRLFAGSGDRVRTGVLPAQLVDSICTGGRSAAAPRRAVPHSRVWAKMPLFPGMLAAAGGVRSYRSPVEAMAPSAMSFARMAGPPPGRTGWLA